MAPAASKTPSMAPTYARKGPGDGLKALWGRAESCLGCPPQRRVLQLVALAALASPTAAAPPDLPMDNTKPHPFIRIVQYFMDNCAGTNKSQFVFGALALLTLTGVLDSMCLEFMIPGHTKMRLDVAFSRTGNAFRSRDVFNLGMLSDIFKQYVDVQAYKEDFIGMYRTASTALFGEVNGIKKSRSFTILGDDGFVHQDLVAAPGSGPGVYTAKSMRKAVVQLAKRSLFKIIPQALEGKAYRGVGDGTGLYGALAPEKTSGFRHVRLPRSDEFPWGSLSRVRFGRDLPLSAAAAAPARCFFEVWPTGFFARGFLETVTAATGAGAGSAAGAGCVGAGAWRAMLSATAASFQALYSFSSIKPSSFASFAPASFSFSLGVRVTSASDMAARGAGDALKGDYLGSGLRRGGLYLTRPRLNLFRLWHMSMPTLRVAVGSTNPVKVASVKAAFAKSFGAAVVTSSHDVASGVSDQPYGDLETRTGALERAAAALRADADADYAVGLEGGVVDAAQGGLESVAWMAVTRRRDGRRNVARTASFLLPPRVTRLLRGEEPGYDKMELGDADDVVFSDVGSKRKGGAIAKVTRGALDRSGYYEHALICALVPFLHDATGLYDDAEPATVRKKRRASAAASPAKKPKREAYVAASAWPEVGEPCRFLSGSTWFDGFVVERNAEGGVDMKFADKKYKGYRERYVASDDPADFIRVKGACLSPTPHLGPKSDDECDDEGQAAAAPAAADDGKCAVM